MCRLDLASAPIPTIADNTVALADDPPALRRPSPINIGRLVFAKLGDKIAARVASRLDEIGPIVQRPQPGSRRRSDRQPRTAA